MAQTGREKCHARRRDWERVIKRSAMMKRGREVENLQGQMCVVYCSYQDRILSRKKCCATYFLCFTSMERVCVVLFMSGGQMIFACVFVNTSNVRYMSSFGQRFRHFVGSIVQTQVDKDNKGIQYIINMTIQVLYNFINYNNNNKHIEFYYYYYCAPEKEK